MNTKMINALFSPRSIQLSRRSLLSSAVKTAGLTVFPLLNQLANAQSAQARRFVFFVEGNGVEPVTMLSPRARAALEPTLSRPLGVPRYWHDDYRHRSVMSVATPDLAAAKSLASLGELQNRATVVFGLSSKISGGGHSNFHGGLSCTKTTDRVPGGPTIDALLAKQLGGQTPFDAMRAGVVNGGSTLDFGVTAFEKGKASPVIMSPPSARDVYFSSIINRSGFTERSKILDAVRLAIDNSMRHFPTGAEHAKLEAYAESIELLVRRQNRIAQHSSGNIIVPEATDSSDPLVKLAEQTQLVTTGLIGGLTNVAVIPIGTSGADTFDLRYGAPYSIGRHGLHHQAERASNAGSDEATDMIHAITADKIGQMMTMARALAATPDVGGGDMLSNTVLVYLPDTGERHHSRAAEWPTLVVGGEAMGVRQGGRTIIYPGIKDDNHRQLSNFWNTMGHLAGLDLNEFGDETDVTRKAKGPLSELMS